MVSNPVEELKRQYTDKYVAVDAARPELARFRGAVGQVKTVNMNGRALVQFMDYHLNTGWYDIDLGSLKIVDAPPKDAPAKPEAKRTPDKPEGKVAPTAGDKQMKDAAATGEKKKLSPLEMARMQGAGGAAKAAPVKSASPAKTEATAAADKPAAAAPAKVDRGKMSVAEMLAAARANKPGAAAAAAPKAAPAPAAKAPAPETAPAPKTEAPASTPEPAAAGEIKRIDKSSMSVADMIAYCRKVDTK